MSKRQRYQKCKYNPELSCWINLNPKLQCPRDDEEWVEIVDRWALDRAPSCVDWDVIRGSQRVTDDDLVELCNVHQLLRYPDDVMMYCRGQMAMQLHICKDLMRGLKLWTAAGMGFPRVAEERRIDKKYPGLAEKG